MRTKVDYEIVEKYVISAQLVSPLHTGTAVGTGQEVLIHPVDDFPFIQASSLTGAMRDYYQARFGEKEAAALFGSANDGDTLDQRLIRITDGVFCGENKPVIELRPRVRIDPASGTVSASIIGGSGSKTGHKFDTEYIGKGAVFRFCVYAFGREGTLEKVRENLMSTFSGLHQGIITLGGHKSAGCGRVEIDRLYHRQFDLRSDSGRKEWGLEQNDKIADYEDLKPFLKKETDSSYIITVEGEVENSIMVKGYQVAGFGKDIPDAVNIRDAVGDFIIPGTSLKGVLRNRAEWIAEYLHLEEKVVEELFGSKESGPGAVVGNGVFYDAVIGTAEANENASVSHRIHIDKFTGGVFNKGLFHEKPAYGKVKIRIDVKNRKGVDQGVGLLIMVLRDLANGYMNLGGGGHIGRGFLDVSSICIEKDQKKSVIDFKTDRITDESGLLNGCIAAVGKGV